MAIGKFDIDFGWRLIGLIIGWLGIINSTIGVSLLFIYHGHNILLILILLFGRVNANFWLISIIVAFRKFITASLVVSRFKIINKY